MTQCYILINYFVKQTNNKHVEGLLLESDEDDSIQHLLYFLKG